MLVAVPSMSSWAALTRLANAHDGKKPGRVSWLHIRPPLRVHEAVWLVQIEHHATKPVSVLADLAVLLCPQNAGLESVELERHHIPMNSYQDNPIEQTCQKHQTSSNLLLSLPWVSTPNCIS